MFADEQYKKPARRFCGVLVKALMLNCGPYLSAAAYRGFMFDRNMQAFRSSSRQNRKTDPASMPGYQGMSMMIGQVATPVSGSARTAMPPLTSNSWSVVNSTGPDKLTG